MRRFWLRGLCVWAGYFVGSASAQEPAWRPSAPRPLAIARTEGVPLSRSSGIGLGRPQPLDDPPAETAPVITTSFRAVADTPAPFQGVGESPLAAAHGLEHQVLSSDLRSSPHPALPPGLESAFASDIPRPLGAGGVAIPAGESADEGDGNALSAPPVFGWRSILTPQGRFYVSGEYLLWWSKGFDTPVLATTSPPNVPQGVNVPTNPLNPTPVAGVLGFPTTTTLFGGSPITFDGQSGFRFKVGYWLDCEHLWAIEGGGFFLGQSANNFAVDSLTTPVIARPFLGVTPFGTRENAELVASPGIVPGDAFASQGRLTIDSSTQLWGAELNARRNICCGCDYRVDVLAGFRYLHLDEGLHITEDLVALRAVPAAGINVGDRIIVTDRFDTKNDFYGAQLGVVAEYRYGRWFAEGTFKLGLGVVHQVVDIHGSTTITPLDPTVAGRQFGQGLLALDSNSGTFSRDRFAVVPEVGLKVGYQLTDQLRAFVGYNFLYVSSVVRPGDQIDRALDEGKIPPFTAAVAPGQPRPLVPFKPSDFWAQGLTVGFEWRY